MSEYTYDVFLSYKRGGKSEDWVRLHFLPLLRAHLEEELGRPCRIFRDEDSIQTGTLWPAELEKALRGCRVMLGVWSRRYFSSSWCCGELETLRRRREQIGAEHEHALVFPIRFQDGDRYPDYARNFQSQDFNDVNSSLPVFRNSQGYLELDRKVRALAVSMVSAIENPPPWSAGWPISLPSLSPTPEPSRLPKMESVDE